jgi:hypothetical protein
VRVGQCEALNNILFRAEGSQKQQMRLKSKTIKHLLLMLLAHTMRCTHAQLLVLFFRLA